MKKILILMLCIITIFLVSGCGKNYEKQMWGTWESNSDIELNGVKVMSMNYTYIIEKDGTFKYLINNDEISDKTGEYKIKKNIITFTAKDDEILIWEYDEDKDIMYQLKDDVRTGIKYERK